MLDDLAAYERPIAYAAILVAIAYRLGAWWRARPVVPIASPASVSVADVERFAAAAGKAFGEVLEPLMRAIFNETTRISQNHAVLETRVGNLEANADTMRDQLDEHARIVGSVEARSVRMVANAGGEEP